MQDKVYTVKQVSEILQVNVNRVYDLIRTGLLPALKLGNLKIREASLEKFLEDYDGMDLSDLYNIKKLDLCTT